MSSASYEKHDGTQFDVTIERDLDLRIVKRSGYTILDLISNVGGLRTLMAFGITVVMGYWNFNTSSNHMVSRLFSYRVGKVMRDEAQTEKPQNEPLSIDGKTFGLSEYFRGLFPSCFKNKSDN